MQLFWQALNAIRDAFADAPDAVRTGAMIAFSIALLVAWAVISTRRPKLGIAVNVAIIALVIVEVLAVAGTPPPRGDTGGLVLINTLFWVGEAIIGLFGVVGAIVAIVTLIGPDRDQSTR